MCIMFIPTGVEIDALNNFRCFIGEMIVKVYLWTILSMLYFLIVR